jgi:hypothetical protein
VEALNIRAKAAFDLATKTWNEAKDTHDSLSDFYSKVDQSKQEALDVSSKVALSTKTLFIHLGTIRASGYRKGVKRC